jgi:hypothetical protein
MEDGSLQPPLPRPETGIRLAQRSDSGRPDR